VAADASKLLLSGALAAPSPNGPKLCSAGRLAALKGGTWKEARGERPQIYSLFLYSGFYFLL
jgi:hypothetical protein